MAGFCFTPKRTNKPDILFNYAVNVISGNMEFADGMS